MAEPIPSTVHRESRAGLEEFEYRHQYVAGEFETGRLSLDAYLDHTDVTRREGRP